MAPLLALVEIGFSIEGDDAFNAVLPQMEQELKGIPGMLEYRLYPQPERMYLFYTVWEDQEFLDRWVANEFHRSVLMTNFRKWAVEGVFEFWTLERDNPRARKCPSCGRWTQAQPGWSSREPTVCVRCGADLLVPSSAPTSQ